MPSPKDQLFNWLSSADMNKLDKPVKPILPVITDKITGRELIMHILLLCQEV